MDQRNARQRHRDRNASRSASWYSDNGMYMNDINEVLRKRPVSGVEYDANDHEMLVMEMGEVLYREDGVA